MHLKILLSFPLFNYWSYIHTHFDPLFKLLLFISHYLNNESNPKNYVKVDTLYDHKYTTQYKMCTWNTNYNWKIMHKSTYVLMYACDKSKKIDLKEKIFKCTNKTQNAEILKKIHTNNGCTNKLFNDLTKIGLIITWRFVPCVLYFWCFSKFNWPCHPYFSYTC